MKKDTKQIQLAKAVLKWASTPGNHGGNPYMKEHVRLAERILAEYEMREPESWSMFRDEISTSAA